MSYSATRRKRFTAGVLAGAMAFTVMPILGFTGTAGAAHLETADPIGDGNVCEDAPETDPFTDVSDADPAVDEIRCLANTEPVEITKGTTPTTYSPNASTQRGQMALFLQRIADLAEAHETSEDAVQELPAGDGETPFTDIGDWPAEHQSAIDRLEEAGITEGVTPTEFRPGDFVSRRQMAKFLVRLQTFLAGEDFEPAVINDCTDCFNDDDGDSGEDELNTLAREGVFIGVAGTGEAHNVEPGEDITRRQMAFVLTRKLEVLFESDLIGRLFAEDDSAAATTRPELESASIGTTVTAAQVSPGNPEGTRVSYVFDENIDLFAPTGANFHIYNADGSQADTGNGVVLSRSGNTVVVNFPSTNTAALATQLTLATVDFGAVTDNQNQTNPEGDAAIGTAAGPGTVGTAGITNAPDLVSVGNFRPAATANNTAVDFTFDEAAWVEALGGFDLIHIDGAELDCTGPAVGSTDPAGGTSPGGNGTTTITVVCENEPTGAATPAAPTLTASTVARGTIAADTVDDTAAVGGGNLNELQAADVAGSSADPDLVSATFQPSPGTADDQVLFVFDENVATATAANFGVYDIGGTRAPGTAATINPGNTTQVLVNFPDGTLADAVGVNVVDGAVTAADSGGTPNQQDEVGVANAQTTGGRTPGQTAAPELRGVALAQGTDQFGNPTGFQATYTFDEPVTTAVAAGEFMLYLADGTQLVGSTCARVAAPASPAGTAGEDQVRCTAYGAATSAQIGSATVGTVDDGAVVAVDNAQTNPEGAEVTTGGTGTPAS